MKHSARLKKLARRIKDFEKMDNSVPGKFHKPGSLKK